MIQARLADGRVLNFPDGTDPAVVQATVKRMVGAAKSPDFADVRSGGSAAPAPASGADPAYLKSQLTVGGDAYLDPLGPEFEPSPDQEARLAAKRAELENIRQHGDIGHQDIPDPGYLGMAGAALKEMVAGPMIGLAERQNRLVEHHPILAAVAPSYPLTAMLPEGLRENVREDFERTRENYLATDPGTGRALLAGGTEMAAGLLPFAPGVTRATAAVGEGAARLAGRLAPETFEAGSAASRLLSHGVGGATFGGLIGLGNTSPDLPAGEQARQIGLSSLLGGAIGGLGGAREVARLSGEGAFLPGGRMDPAFRHAQAPKPSPPEVRQQLLSAFELDKSLVAERAAATGDPKVQAKAVGEIEAKWQPEFAQGGAAGDEILGQMADRLQGHVAPEVKAPPVPAVEQRGNIRFRREVQEAIDRLSSASDAELADAQALAMQTGDRASEIAVERVAFQRKAGTHFGPPGEGRPAELPRPAPAGREPAQVAVDGGTPAEQARILALWNYASRRYPRIAATVPEIEIMPAGQGMGGSVNLLDGGISLPADATLADLMHEITHSAQRLKMSRTLSEESAVRRELAYRGVPEADPLPPRPGEAGFLRLGRNKPPAPPPSPIEAVMPRNEPTPSPAGPLGRLQAAADRVTDLWFNREDAPVRRMRRAGLKAEADYLEQMQARARGAGGMLDPQHQAGPVYDGTYVFDPNLNGPGKFGSRRTGDGLQAIVGGMDDQALYDLDSLLASRRQNGLEGRAAAGDPIQIDPRGTAIAQQTLADLEARYGTEPHPVTGAPRVRQLDAVAERFRDWTVRAWMIPLKEAGRFSDAEFTYQQNPDGSFTYGGDIVAKNDLYAPFQRLMEVLGDEDVYGLSPVTSGKPNPIHAITGGLSPDTPIARPVESAVELAQKATLWVERQRVRNLFGDAVDSSPELQLEIRKLSPQGGAGTGPKTGLPIHVRGDFPVWRDGVRTNYTAPPDVLRAVESLSPKQAGPVMEAAKLAARMLRAGATITLEFPFRNLGRDVQDAAIYGPGYNPVFKVLVDPFAGLLDVVGHGRWSKEWRANGGALSGATAVGRPQIEASLRDVTGQRGRIARRFETEIGGRFGEQMRQGPLKATTTLMKTGLFPFMAPMEALAENLESATKVGAYRRMRLRGMDPGEAAAISRDVSSPDFGRAGSAGQVWNQVEAFSNAELQDLYRLGRAFRRNPGTTTIKAMAFLTLPAIANWYKNKDDEQYQALPEWERVAFYHPVKLGAGRWVRIPRPLGMINLAFSYGPQKLLEKMAGEDPDAVEEFGRAFVDQTPLHYLPQMENLRGGGRSDWLPTIAQPLAEVAAGPAGYSSFREGPIDTTAMFPDAAPLPEDRVRDQTSGIARAAGKALNVSPIKVDYLLQGYGAFWGRTLAQGTGPAARALGADPSQDTLMGRMAQGGTPQLPTTAADIPGVRGFVSTSAIGFGSDPVTKFYKLATEAAQAKKSLRDARESGDVNRYISALREHPEAAFADALYDDRKKLSEMRKRRNEILSNGTLTPEQREDLLISIDQYVAAYAGARMHGYSDILHNMREK